VQLGRGALRNLLLAALFLAASNCEPRDILPPPPASPPPPVPPVPPPPPKDEVFIGAGDIASCENAFDEQTAAIVDTIEGTVFVLGDNVYNNGSPDEYADCYASSWGRFRSRTRPVPGNHDYMTAFAAGYFNYFGSRAGEQDKGYYSFDLGGWHIIALNSNIGMSASSAQVAWLKADLAASTKRCTLAMWHHPRFSSGRHGNWGSPGPLWEALYTAGAEVVLVGHDHLYERFGPQTPTGAADAQYGIRQFVVGTGGSSNYEVVEVQPNSEVRASGNPGVLKLVLKAESYTWQFIPIAGKTFTDSGEGSCHGPNPDPPVLPPATSDVLISAGNIGDCSGDEDDRTGRILDTLPGTILTLGDNAFPDGTLTDYTECYDPSWGRHKSRTWATIGNHEYNTGNANGAWDYFGDRAGPRGLGYYSFNLGDWHVIVLNDNLPNEPYAVGSPQDQWLTSDLAEDQKRCTLAAWHAPAFLSSQTAGFTTRNRRAMWDRLYAAGVDVVLNAQQHHYERMAPMKPDGSPDPVNGIRQFNVGTGGESIELPTVAIHPQSEVRAARYGVLKLTLDSTSYRWDFIPISGSPVDSGSAQCH
jgi:hypothetical protein